MRVWGAAFWLVVGAGCAAEVGPGLDAGEGEVGADLGVGGDMKVAAQRFAVTEIYLPQGYRDFAVDLDGDRFPDNEFESFVSQWGGPEIQKRLQLLVDIGLIVVLIEMPYVDSNEPPVTVFTGKVGRVKYEVDRGIRPVVFSSTKRWLRSYVATAPYGPAPPLMIVTIPTLMGDQVFMLPLRVHRIEVEMIDETHMVGEMQGSIPIEALRDNFTRMVPQWNAQLADPNTDPNLKSYLLSTFDRPMFFGGPCVNPDGTMGVGGDGVISPCEVAKSWLVMWMTRPDIRVLDDHGHYGPIKPVMWPSVGDSMSFGLGFAAVAAEF